MRHASLTICTRPQFALLFEPRRNFDSACLVGDTTYPRPIQGATVGAFGRCRDPRAELSLGDLCILLVVWGSSVRPVGSTGLLQPWTLDRY